MAQEGCIFKQEIINSFNITPINEMCFKPFSCTFYVQINQVSKKKDLLIKQKGKKITGLSKGSKRSHAIY